MNGLISGIVNAGGERRGRPRTHELGRCLQISAFHRSCNPVLERLLNSSGSDSVAFRDPLCGPAANKIEFDEPPLNVRTVLVRKLRIGIGKWT